MSFVRGLRRPALVLAGLCVSGNLVSCTRASASAFMPSLKLGVEMRRTRTFASGSSAQASAAERWETVALLGFSFRPRSVASELPVRAELAPETWIAPCDADDFICLQEAADAEEELRIAFGELQ